VIAAGLSLAVLAAVGSGGAAAAPASPPAAANEPVAWKTVAPGAERASLPVGGIGDALLFRFDLDKFRAEVVVGKGTPPHPRTATDLRQGRGAVAAVNGGFFDEHVMPLGLRIAGGDQRFPLRPKADWGVLVLGNHRARIIHTREYPRPGTATALASTTPANTNTPPSPAVTLPSPIDGAIQVGPRLLVGGQPVKLRPQLARRTAVAVDREGRTLTLVVTDTPVPADDLASALAAQGFDAALLLDGGPSTQLSLAVGDAQVEIEGAYPVPDLLAIFTRAPPHRAPAPPRPSAPSPPSPR
jgi:uncharacterized protein YigE (DUF2233 family)